MSAPSLRCAVLGTLELQKGGALDDALVGALAAEARQLESLNLTDCKLLREPRLACEKLRILHLYNCVHLLSVTVLCPSLELLNLTHSTALASLHIGCPKLGTLLCGGCKLLADACVRVVVDACRALHTCDVKGCELLSEATLKALEEQLSSRRQAASMLL